MAKLPSDWTAEAILKRREKACTRKDQWRSTYSDAYRYACPQRETYSWTSPGQKKQILYDSTLQTATSQAASTMISLLFPPWSRWAELEAGALFPAGQIPQAVRLGLQNATDAFFSALNHSNFQSVIGEACLDLCIGTAGLTFEAGTVDQPFRFRCIPLSAIEFEEGPFGSVENTFQARKVRPRDLTRLFPGLEGRVPADLARLVKDKPDDEIEIVQCELFDPQSGDYYGIAIFKKEIFWTVNRGADCPSIIARAATIAGEQYGRGRALLALPDARTLDTMQEFILRNAALQVAPPLLGVSDGVLNPYTAQLLPNSVIPVAALDSLKPIETGGNFNISSEIMNDLRARVQRTMLGPDATDAGPVKTATEISIADRNRLWALGSEFSRIEEEFIARIVKRGVYILQQLGIVPPFQVNGRAVKITWTSPFAQSQNSKDVAALEQTLQIAASLGGGVVAQGISIEDIPGYVGRKLGVDENLIRSDDEREQMAQAAQSALAQNAPAQAAQPLLPAAQPQAGQTL